MICSKLQLEITRTAAWGCLLSAATIGSTIGGRKFPMAGGKTGTFSACSCVHDANILRGWTSDILHAAGGSDRGALLAVYALPRWHSIRLKILTGQSHQTMMLVHFYRGAAIGSRLLLVRAWAATFRNHNRERTKHWRVRGKRFSWHQRLVQVDSWNSDFLDGSRRLHRRPPPVHRRASRSYLERNLELHDEK